MDKSLRSLYRNAAEWLAGPTGSIALHVTVILAAIFLFSMVAPKKDDPGVEVTVVEVEDTKFEELEPDEFEPPPEMEELVDPVDIPDVDIDLPPPDIPDDFAADSSMINEVSELVVASDISSPIVMKGLQAGEYAHRSVAGRGSAKGYAGKWAEAAEAAVKRALVWLKNNQRDDGSWGRYSNRAPDYAPDLTAKFEGTYNEAFTGLAILCFLAHGETTASQEFGDTVKRAIQFLVARQNEKGEFTAKGIDTDAATYTQCICTYAISEAYGMMRIPELRSVMERAVQRVIDGQQASGAFDYKFAKQNQRDTSLAGWAGQCMKAAYIAGAKNPGLKEAMEKVVAEVKTAQRDDGTFWYREVGKSRHTLNITAIGCLTLQLLGHAQDKECKAGLDALNSYEYTISGSKRTKFKGAVCDWDDPMEWPMYAWYYIAQAKFHQGGDTWNRWNAEFAPQFIRAQWIQDPENKALYGSWISAGINNHGSQFDGHEDNYGRIYATTFAALTLQVYYRHLPTYQPIKPIEEEESDDDDVAIKIL